MISPHTGRAIFRIAFYVALTSGVLLFFLKPGSAEFVVATITLLIGVIFIVLIALILQRRSR